MYYPKQSYFTCNTNKAAAGEQITCLVGADALTGSGCGGTPPASSCTIQASDVSGAYAACRFVEYK